MASASSLTQDTYGLGQALAAYRVVYDGLKQRYDCEYQELDDACTAIDIWKSKWTRESQKLTPARVKHIDDADLTSLQSDVTSTMERLEEAKTRAFALLTAMQKGTAFFIKRPIPVFDIELNEEETNQWQSELQEMEHSIRIVYQNMQHRIPLAQHEANKVYDCLTKGSSSTAVNYVRYLAGAKAYGQVEGSAGAETVASSDGKKEAEDDDSIAFPEPDDKVDGFMAEGAEAADGVGGSGADGAEADDLVLVENPDANDPDGAEAGASKSAMDTRDARAGESKRGSQPDPGPGKAVKKPTAHQAQIVGGTRRNRHRNRH